MWNIVSRTLPDDCLAPLYARWFCVTSDGRTGIPLLGPAIKEWIIIGPSG